MKDDLKNNEGRSQSSSPHREMPPMTDDHVSVGAASDDRNPVEQEEYLLTVSEFAECAQMHPETIRRLCRERKLRHIRIGGPSGNLRIPSGVLHDYIGGR